MFVYVAHRECLKTKYKTVLFSGTTLFLIFALICTFIIPYLFARAGGDLWKKNQFFIEQPRVKFTGEYFLTFITSNLSNPIVCSTFPEPTEEIESFDRCTLIKAREIDYNYDGLPDAFFFSATIDLSSSVQKPLAANLIVSFDYKLKDVCPLNMLSAITWQQHLLPSTSTINIYGDLNFEQATPLPCLNRKEDNRYNYSVTVDGSNPFDDFVQKYSQRTISTHLKNIYTTIQLTEETTFTINLNVRYPEQQFCYRTNLWQILKWAWIQYFSIFIIVVWLVKGISGYLFRNKLLLFYKEKPDKQD